MSTSQRTVLAPNLKNSQTKRLILLGGGHVHVQVLKHLIKNPLPNIETVLISEEPEQLYSGMLPGLMGGFYIAEQCQFDLPEICARAGVRFLRATANGLDLVDKTVATNCGPQPYDLLSINVGSRPALEVDDPRVTPLKPLHFFYDRWLKILNEPNSRVAILGGGAAGVEVALMAAARLNVGSKRVTLYEKSNALMRNLPPRAAQIARDRAQEVGLKIVTEFVEPISKLSEENIFLALPPQAPVWFRSTLLKLSPAGFVAVDKNLRALGHENIFAAGDCIEFTPSPHAHAGVYAVRHAPILIQNILRVLAGDQILCDFHPQSDFLHLLTLGGRKALLVRRPFVFASNLNWRFKDFIDRKYMQT